MTADDLKSLLSGPQPPNLINVLPPEVFAIRHIPGSLNACVYEITFGDKVRTLAPDLSREIVVYGAGEGGLEAKVAGDRLTESGYQNVRVFDGGMKEWLSARLPIEGNHDTPAKHIEGIYVLDNKASQIRWTGRNLFNHHHGFLLLANGRMEMRNEKLIDASFEIDMRSIVCEDIADQSMRKVLIQHLMNADFFDVEKHPIAKFEATTIQPIASATDGTPNYAVTGNFTLRGIQRPLRIPCVLAASPDGSKITAQAQIDLDRTEFGSLYGSGKFFHHLGQHVVNDHVHLHLKIHATREG